MTPTGCPKSHFRGRHFAPITDILPDKPANTRNPPGQCSGTGDNLGRNDFLMAGILLACL